jgi:uncharacterized protein (DUF983 family)
MPNNFFKKVKRFNPEITHGVCPTCEMPTMLVSLTRDFYRCITCGTDLEQKINGVIKYMPIINESQETKPEA